MSSCTVAEVMSDAAALVGDDGMEQFNSSIQAPWFGFAYRELFNIYQRWRLPIGTTTGFAFLPAYTNVLVPSLAGITDMGEPEGVWERPASTTVTVTGATNATPVEITTSGAHGLATNAEVELYNIAGPVGVNGQWFITVTAANKFTLNGSVAGGAYSSGGTVVEATVGWSEVLPSNNPPSGTPVNTALRTYKWQKDRFNFPGATSAVELKMEYTVSGNPPASGTIAIDDCRNHLAVRTASLLAANYDQKDRAAELIFEAFGDSRQPDGTGGTLRNLVGPQLLEKQNRVNRAQPFRPRRNTVTRWW